MVLRCLLDPKSGVSLSRFKPIMIRGGSDPKHSCGYRANSAMKFGIFLFFEVCLVPMRLCAVQEHRTRDPALLGLKHMSALKHDPGGLLLGPAGRCQSAEVDQRSLALLLMSMRRVRGSISLETS